MLRLSAAAAAEDGVGPLSDQTVLHVRHGGDPGARNLLLWRDGDLAGFAHLDAATDPAEARSGELVVHPAHRRQGLGRMLVQAITAEAGAARCGCGRTATCPPPPPWPPVPGSPGRVPCGG